MASSAAHPPMDFADSSSSSFAACGPAGGDEHEIKRIEVKAKAQRKAIFMCTIQKVMIRGKIAIVLMIVPLLVAIAIGYWESASEKTFRSISRLAMLPVQLNNGAPDELA